MTRPWCAFFYQTFGNIAVTDDEALRFAEVCNDYIGIEKDLGSHFKEVIIFINSNKVNEINATEVQK